MSLSKKLALIGLFLAGAYSTAWIQAYQMSSDYFKHAQEVREKGELVTALKGMNKLELRIDDEYLGGYQQVIETWESSILGIRPGFYREAVAASQDILPHLSDDTLLEFIEIYIQLDMRYVPEAARELLKRATVRGDETLAQEMTEFLLEAFPEYD